MVQKAVEFNGKHLFYRSSGSGPLVVLLHGFGEDGTVWREQWMELPGFHVIVPDLPGSGNSQPIDDMSMEGMAAAVKRIVEKESSNAPVTSGEGKAVLIGHSMGGYISLAFAEKYPELLNGLGLFHSTAFADSAEKVATRKKGIKFIQDNGAFEFLKTAIPGQFSEVTKDSNPSLIEEQVLAARNFSQEALVAYYEAMIRRPDRTGLLQGKPYPVLFILGKHDNTVPLSDGLKQAHLPEKAHLHILEQSGHMGMREEPATSAALLREYLSALG
ncbi:alpha/beta hydrolase [Paraflavisolibacter sp. H34]|uniref:alpha/beta fold hydrolase n=1 Tax=Huijunlia imazamoxiresistens TaxID=3127457 RepID=UPI0030164FF2